VKGAVIAGVKQGIPGAGFGRPQRATPVLPRLVHLRKMADDADFRILGQKPRLSVTIL
jgi:hypothetical protein